MGRGWGAPENLVTPEAEVLTMELPELGCESTTHGDPRYQGFHDEGPATHYAKIMHDCDAGHPRGTVYPVCRMLAQSIMSREAEGLGVICLNCHEHFTDVTEWVVIVGKISRGKGKK